MTMCGSSRAGALAGGILGYALAPETGGMSLLGNVAMGAMAGANLAAKPAIPAVPALASTPEMPSIDSNAVAAASKKAVAAMLQQGGRPATILNGVAGKRGGSGSSSLGG